MALFAKQIVDFDIDDRTEPYQDSPGVVGSPWHLPRIKQGDTMLLYVDLYLADGVTPANLNSDVFTFTGQMRSRDRSPKIEANLTITIVSNQRIALRIEASEAANMTAELGTWDAEVTYEDGGAEPHKDTFISGSYGLDLQVTR